MYSVAEATLPLPCISGFPAFAVPCGKTKSLLSINGAAGGQGKGFCVPQAGVREKTIPLILLALESALQSRRTVLNL